MDGRRGDRRGGDACVEIGIVGGGVKCVRGDEIIPCRSGCCGWYRGVLLGFRLGLRNKAADNVHPFVVPCTYSNPNLIRRKHGDLPNEVVVSGGKRTPTP